jgi:hypothetical protein
MQAIAEAGSPPEWGSLAASEWGSYIAAGHPEACPGENECPGKRLRTPASTRLPLGKGEDLAGKVVTVYTVVTDIRDRRNDISVTWILTGGEKPLTVEKEGSAPKSFGSQMFKGEFKLTEPK